MHKHTHEPLPESLQAGYEVSDMNARAVMALIAGVTLMAVFGFFATIWFIKLFERTRPTGIMPSPVADQSPQLPDVTYLLQSNPVGDKDRLFAEQLEKLNSYGSNDALIGHMPIDRAIEIMSSGEVDYRQRPTEARLAEGANVTPPTPEQVAPVSQEALTPNTAPQVQGDQPVPGEAPGQDEPGI